MPQAKKRYYWEADVQLELQNIALGVKSEKKSRGNKEIYLLGAQDGSVAVRVVPKGLLQQS